MSIHIFFFITSLFTATIRALKKICICGRVCPRDEWFTARNRHSRNELTGIRSDSITRLPRLSHKNLRNSFLQRSVPLSSLVLSSLPRLYRTRVRSTTPLLPSSKALCTTTYEFESFYRILIFSRHFCPSPPLECDPTDSRIRCQMLGQGNLRNDRFTTTLYMSILRMHSAAVRSLPALMEVQ